MEVRYFVLYDDRLDYYYREEECSSGVEPRGRLALSDIQRFEASEFELVFHLLNQNLVLSPVEGINLQPWINDINALLSEAAVTEKISWEEIDKRLPTSQKRESRTARSEIFDRLDRLRNGQLPLAEVERALPERLVSHAADGAGRANLVPNLPPLESPVQRAVEIAVDVCSHMQGGKGNDPDFLDRRGFHAALLYFRGYVELSVLYQQIDVTGVVDISVAKPLMEKWGIPPERVQQRFPACTMVKFEDFADWMLWCKLTNTHAIELDDPEDFLKGQTDWVAKEEAAAKLIQNRLRTRNKARMSRQAEKKEDWVQEQTMSTIATEAATEVTAEAEDGAPEFADDMDDGSSAGIICQGPLSFQRGGSRTRRHHVLFTDRLCCYEEKADVRQGKDPRGSIALSDVEAVEELGQGFQVVLRNATSMTEFQADSKEENDRWLHAWALVLQRNLGVSFARAKHPQAWQKAVADEAENATVICEGTVEMIKKNRSEPRHFVLFDKHFEYYNSKEEFTSQAPPRCRVALEDVQDVEVNNSGSLVIQLAQGKTFEMRVRTQEDARRWGQAWDKALSSGPDMTDVTSVPPNAGAGPVNWGEGWPEVNNFSRHETESPVPSQADEAREADARQVRAPPSVSWGLKVEEETVLHEGVVVMGRGEDNLQPRFAVVLSDRLEYTTDWGMGGKAAGPRTRILRTQVRDVEVVDEGFRLELEDGLLLMRTSSETDQQAWLNALEAMLEGQGSGGGKSTSGPTPSPEPAAGRPRVLLQETIDLELGGKVDKRHLVLYNDCLEYFNSQGEANSGARPQGIIWRRDMTSLEVLDFDFVIHSRDRTVVLHAGDERSFSAWQKALLPMFGTISGTPSRSSRATPLCQGLFRIVWGVGNKEKEETLSLYHDRLECASGQLATHEIEDVEVCDTGFVFHGKGCRISVKFAGKGGDTETWLAALGRVLDGEEAPGNAATTPVAPSSGSRSSREMTDSTPVRKLCRTSSDLAAGPTRCVHEGRLELDPWKGQRRPRHAVLYGTKLDLFGAAEEADGGHPPFFSVPIDGIQELRVLDLAFEIRTSSVTAARQLRVLTRREFDDWHRAFAQVLGGDPEMERRADGRGWFRSCSGSGVRSPGTVARRHTVAGVENSRGANARGRWANSRSASNSISRGNILHQGQLALVRQGRTEAYHFVALEDRLEYYSDPSSATMGLGRRGVLRPTDIREVRVLEHGFVLGMVRESIELHVASTRDMDIWVKVLRTVLDPAASEESDKQQDNSDGRDDEEELEGMSNYFSQSSIFTGQDTAEAAAARIGEWLESLQERPLHRGELGFEDKGRLAKRFCVLFKDRLDCWELMAPPSSKPAVRIELSDVRGLEIISSGFVLNSRGRRTGVHVGNNEDLQAWTRALLSVLAPSEGSEVATGPATPQTSVPSTPSCTAGLGARPRSASQSGPTGRSSSSRPSLLRQRLSAASMKGSFVPRCASVTPSASSRAHSPRHTAPAGLNSSMSLHTVHDPRPVVKLNRPQLRDAGGEWSCREVAGKIVEPVAGRSPLLQQREERVTVAEKVTGMRTGAPSRGKSEISGKITETAEGSRGSRVSKAGSGEVVAMKVNEAGRVPLLSARNVPTHGMAEKITKSRVRRSKVDEERRCSSQPLVVAGPGPGSP